MVGGRLELYKSVKLSKFKEERAERQARAVATVEAQERERKKMQVRCVLALCFVVALWCTLSAWGPEPFFFCFALPHRRSLTYRYSCAVCAPTV